MEITECVQHSFSDDTQAVDFQVETGFRMCTRSGRRLVYPYMWMQNVGHQDLHKTMMRKQNSLVHMQLYTEFPKELLLNQHNYGGFCRIST